MDVNTSLKDGGRGSGPGVRGKYLSGVLVVVEMTLAVVLLAGAGLMIRSFLIAYQRPAGIDTANVMTMRIDLPGSRYARPADQLEFHRKLVERLRALPGVESASVASTVHGVGNLGLEYELEGRPADPQKRPTTAFLMAGDGYFESLHLSAQMGRLFNAADQQPGALAAVVNTTAARQLWPNENPVGKRLRTYRDNAPGEWITVVGMVPDYLQNSQNSNPEPAVIVPYRMDPRPWLAAIARTRTTPSSLGNAFRRAVQEVDSDLPVHDLRTLDEMLALDSWPLRVFGAMFAIFASIALLLATVGLYAVVAHGVSRRTQEIGVRIALGASSGSILGMVFRGGMRQAAIGLILGLAAAFGVTRVLSSLLVGVSPTDPFTFGLVGAVLIASAVLGCLIPARRAMRVDPVVALRYE
jgi:predicted permease